MHVHKHVQPVYRYLYVTLAHQMLFLATMYAISFVMTQKLNIIRGIILHVLVNVQMELIYLCYSVKNAIQSVQLVSINLLIVLYVQMDFIYNK